MNIPDKILPDGYWSDLLRQRIAGKISHQQIVDIVRELHLPAYQEMLSRWMNGTLFYFQKCSFDAWLDVDKPTWEQEYKDAMQFLSFQSGCSEPENSDIHNFIVKRIFKPPLTQRKEISESTEKREMCRDFWRKDNIKYKWDWV